MNATPGFFWRSTWLIEPRRNDDEKRNGTLECECGRRKSDSTFACERCTHLDGKTAAAQLIIEALRSSNGLTLIELCKAVYGHYTHSNGTGMTRCVQALLRKRRVRRYWREADRTPTVKFGGRGATANAGHWVYALDGKTEDGR